MNREALTLLLCEAVNASNWSDARYLAASLKDALPADRPLLSLLLWTPCGYIPAPERTRP
jgi:hypothetical protein